MQAPEQPKRRGAPPKPPEERRTGRLQFRVLPKVAEKAGRIGRSAVEAAILAYPEQASHKSSDGRK